VIEQGENLRDLLGRMFTYSSAQDVPMNYDLAYALAEYAHQKNALETKSTEWEIKRIEVLGLMRKRDFSFKSTVDGEQELRDLEKQVAVIEEQLRECGRKIWVEYDRIKARVARERG
jgi:predicted  nucleic acid-binding Zn-ribbon protein